MGRALKFYSSVRLDVRRTETLKIGTDMIGNRTRIKVVKNKVAPPFKEAMVDIMYGQGISGEGSLIDLGVEMNIVDKSGAWFSYSGDRLGQGRENSKTFLKENPKVAQAIEVQIRASIANDAAANPELFTGKTNEEEALDKE